MKQKQMLKQDLGQLLSYQILREDSMFLAKIVCFVESRQQKLEILSQLSTLESFRQKFENRIVDRYCLSQAADNIIKGTLYDFACKLAKISKAFHTKTFNFSPKLAEREDIGIFLQQSRGKWISMFSDNKPVGEILSSIIQLNRTRFNKDLVKCNFELVKNNWVKSEKYLEILKKQNMSMAMLYLRNLSNRLEEAGLQKRQQSVKVLQDMKQLMQIDQQPYFLHLKQIQADGICDFIIGKVVRVYKQLKSKNQYNQRSISSFERKVSLLKSKTKPQFIIKKPKKSAIKMSPVPNIINSIHHPKFKSLSLRPASQSCQNRQRIVRQTLMEIQVQQTIFATKVLRVRKRIPLAALNRTGLQKNT